MFILIFNQATDCYVIITKTLVVLWIVLSQFRWVIKLRNNLLFYWHFGLKSMINQIIRRKIACKTYLFLSFLSLKLFVTVSKYIKIRNWTLNIPMTNGFLFFLFNVHIWKCFRDFVFIFRIFRIFRTECL